MKATKYTSSFTMGHSLFLALAFVLTVNRIITVTAESSNAACTPCYNGMDLRFDVSPCTELEAETDGLFQTDNDCKDLQLRSYQIGCCNNPPFEHCDYCEDGTEFNPDLKVPSGKYVGGETCFDYKYQNEAYLGLFSDGDCSDTFVRRAGQYCGCPGKKQECWLCPDKQAPNNLGKGEAWVTGSNCRGIEFLFSLLNKDECSSFPLAAGADLAIFCGCGGLNQTEIEEQQQIFQCELCRNGGWMVDPNMVYTEEGDPFTKTCQQAEDFARDIVKTPNACNTHRYFGKARELCCSNGDSAGVLREPQSRVLWSVAMLVVGAVVAEWY